MSICCFSHITILRINIRPVICYQTASAILSKKQSMRHNGNAFDLAGGKPESFPPKVEGLFQDAKIPTWNYFAKSLTHRLTLCPFNYSFFAPNLIYGDCRKGLGCDKYKLKSRFVNINMNNIPISEISDSNEFYIGVFNLNFGTKETFPCDFFIVQYQFSPYRLPEILQQQPSIKENQEECKNNHRNGAIIHFS